MHSERHPVQEAACQTPVQKHAPSESDLIGHVPVQVLFRARTHLQEGTALETEGLAVNTLHRGEHHLGGLQGGVGKLVHQGLRMNRNPFRPLALLVF